MSEVKRYTPELEKDIGLGLPCLSMLVNPYGEWVHYQDYAELKAQRDALAAEEMFNHRDKWIDKEWLSAIWSTSKQLKENTPATTAYLKSVRAEGLDELATFAGQQYQQHAGDKAQQKKWKSIVFLCTQFATQLRAGELS